MIWKYFTILVLIYSAWYVFYLHTEQDVLKDGLNEDKMCQAIWKEEGGWHTSYLYGVKGFGKLSKENAKIICQHTIRHKYKNFTTNGNQSIKGFIIYLAQRYDSGDGRISQERWAKNVTWLYYHKQGE